MQHWFVKKYAYFSWLSTTVAITIITFILNASVTTWRVLQNTVTGLFLWSLFFRMIFFNTLLANLHRNYIILGFIRTTCEILHWEDRGDQCWYQLCCVHKVYRSFGRGKDSGQTACINYTPCCRIEETKTFSRSSFHIQRKHSCSGYFIFEQIIFKTRLA